MLQDAIARAEKALHQIEKQRRGGEAPSQGISGGHSSLVSLTAADLKLLLDTAKMPGAVQTVIQAMRDDPDYAWSWHCNIAMAAVDSGVPHGIANHAAARFMRSLANVEPAHPLPEKESACTP